MQHTVGIVGVRSCCNRATVHMLSAHKYPCPLSALEWQMMALHTLYTGLCTLCGQGRRSHPHVTIIELSGGDSSVITCTCFHDRPEPHISHGILPEGRNSAHVWSVHGGRRGDGHLATFSGLEYTPYIVQPEVFYVFYMSHYVPVTSQSGYYIGVLGPFSKHLGFFLYTRILTIDAAPLQIWHVIKCRLRCNKLVPTPAIWVSWEMMVFVINPDTCICQNQETHGNISGRMEANRCFLWSMLKVRVTEFMLPVCYTVTAEASLCLQEFRAFIFLSVLLYTESGNSRPY